MTTSILPVVFGDYVNDSKADITATGCIDGKMQIQGFVKDVKINYLIDCNNGKSLLTVPDDSFKESNLQIEYSDFFRIDNIYTPGRIEISDIQHNTVIEIKIQRIIIPWEGSIEFIPGKQYEKINLL
ncbi:MAG: hypothetical protein IPJ37_09925 [Bacteroidales bacterium]|nr:hypothetical protein [Bacteroidales bacterium]